MCSGSTATTPTTKRIVETRIRTPLPRIRSDIRAASRSPSSGRSAELDVPICNTNRSAVIAAPSRSSSITPSTIEAARVIGWKLMGVPETIGGRMLAPLRTSDKARVAPPRTVCYS